MICYNCGCRLSEKDFCTSCGADVKQYKKIIHTANWLYNSGLDKATVRDLSGAITDLKQCLKLNKKHIEARNLLGLVYFERGDVVAALREWVISKNFRSEKNIADDYINMIQNNPGRLEAINQTIKKYNLALAYCQQESLDLAVIQLKKVINMNSKFLQARQLLALLYINDQKWELAKKELEGALQIDVNNTITLRYLKEVHQMMPAEEGKGKKKNDVIRYQSGNDTVIQPIGKKENTALQAVLNILIGAVIGLGIAWYLVVPAKTTAVQEEAALQVKMVSEQLDAKTAQVNELTKQIDTLSNEKNSLNNSLTVAERNNVTVEACINLIEATYMYLSKSQDEMAIADTLAMIDSSFLESEAKEGFLNLYHKILDDIGPKVSQNYYNTGYEAYRQEDYATAIENFELAFQYDKNNDEALYHMANAFYRSDNTAMAVETYKQVIELFPNTEKARKANNYIKEIQG